MLTNAEQRLIALRDAQSGDPRLDQMKTPIVNVVLEKVTQPVGK